MRQRVMLMTMGAVMVAVVLLGVPLGSAWVLLALRLTRDSEDRLQIIVTMVLAILGLALLAVVTAYIVAARGSRRIQAPLIYLAATM